MNNLNLTEPEKIKSLIKKMKFAMLVTKDTRGQLHSRPMGTIEAQSDLNSLWFFTSDNSPKSLDIQENELVNLSYANPEDNVYISVCGNAKIVKDREKIKELWTPILKAWFPKGVDDPHICLIEVVPTEAQYWIYPDSTVYQAIQFIKKITIGEDTQIGENKKIDLART